MGEPLILYDLAQVPNGSFELPATPGSAPSSWTVTKGGSSEAEVSATHFYKGDAWAATHGQALNLQRVTPDSEPEVVSDAVPQNELGSGSWWHPVGEVVALVGVAATDGAGSGTLDLWLNEIDSTPTRHTEHQLATVTAPADGSWIGFAGVFTLVGGSADRLEVRIRANTSDRELFVDHLMLGRAVDFDRQFLDVTVRERARREVNLHEGDAWEAFGLAAPFTELSASYGPVDTDATHELQLRKLRALAASWRTVAFWLDRTEHANRDLHFSKALLDEPEDRSFEPGRPHRWGYTLKLTAPLEAEAQVGGR